MECDYEGCGHPAVDPAGELMALCEDHLVEFAEAIPAGPPAMLQFWVRAHGGAGSLAERMLGEATLRVLPEEGSDEDSGD